MNVKKIVRQTLATAMSLAALCLASCSETIDTALERRSQNERAFLSYADSTGFDKVTLPGMYGDRYVYMKWSNKVSDRSLTPKATDYVRMYYTGSLLTSGSVFDSNLNIAAKNTIPLMLIKRGSSGLIDGMAIALQNMAVGDKASIIIPWYLAYGEAGRGTAYNMIIPTYAALRFDVELLEISSEE